MKAQVCFEFLFNFLIMLVFISIILIVFSKLLIVSKNYNSKVFEKIKIEEFVRMLDVSEGIKNKAFFSTGNYSIEQIDSEGVIIKEINGEKVYGYSIYGIKQGYGEPV